MTGKKTLTPRALLDFLRIPYKETSGGAEACLAICPMCGKENHFYLNFETGLYSCQHCKGIGVGNWKTVLLDFVVQCSLGNRSGEYWAGRGMTPEDVCQYKLGYYPAFDRYTIPYIENGRVTNITFRRRSEEHPNQKKEKYLRVLQVHHSHYVLPGTEPLAFVVEGEINAISVKKGFPEATVIGLSGGKIAQESILAAVPKNAKLHALIDDDKGFPKKLKALIPGIHIHLLAEDANEILVNGGVEGLRGTLETIMRDTDEDPGAPAIRSIDAIAYLKLPDETQDWLIEDLWTDGAVGFVAGIPKSMKSMLTLHMAHYVSKGLLFLTKKVNRPGTVLLVQEEDTDHTIRKRLSVFNDTVGSNLRIWTPGITGTHVRLDMDSGLELLDSEIQRVQPILVILDPLANMHALEDENNSGPMNHMLEGLRHIRDLRKCSICVVHHMRKEGAGEGPTSYGQRMRGSSVLHAKAECALYLERVGQTDLVRIRTENKLGPGRNFDIRLKEGQFVLEAEFGAGVGDHPGSE